MKIHPSSRKPVRPIKVVGYNIRSQWMKKMIWVDDTLVFLATFCLCVFLLLIITHPFHMKYAREVRWTSVVPCPI